MLNYLQNIPTGLFIVLGSLVAAFIAVHIQRKNTFNAASIKFKSSILKELEGLVPVNGYWKREEYDRFNKSIPVIKREALEFRSVVPFYSIKGFDKAVTNYCAHSQNMNWHTAAADVLYDKETKVTQKEQFTINVHKLLSYAK